MANQGTAETWRSPTVILTAAGLVISLVGNGIQCYSARTNAEKAHREMRLAEERWKAEEKTLRAELDFSTMLRSQLQQVEKEIGELDGELLLLGTKLKEHRGNHSDAGAAGRQQRIAMQEDVRQKEMKKAELKSRRDALEGLLRSSGS